MLFYVCVSLASRPRSDTKINPVAYVSGSEVEMVPVDLATQAEAPRIENIYCYRYNLRGR